MIRKHHRHGLLLLLGVVCLDAEGAGSFDGAYAGLSLGYVAGEDTGHETPVNPVEGAYSQQTNPNGELLSLAVGYDHRLAERYVVGLAVEGELRNLGEHSVQRLNGVATARASLGYEDPKIGRAHV